MPHHRNAGRNHNINVASEPIENLKYLVITAPHRNYLIFFVYNLIQNLLSSRLMSEKRNITIKMYTDVICPVLYWYEALNEEDVGDVGYGAG
jgi:hypothetical protein